MIALIVIGSILSYFLLGVGTARAVAFFDPSLFHDQWNGGELSILGVTMTVLFWPVTLGLLTLILLGVLFYHGPWQWWTYLMKKAVGDLWDTSALTAVMKS
jgi:hypothetical protein